MSDTTTYAPDAAPDLEPAVVRWQPRHRTHAGETGLPLGEMGLAVALLAGAAVTLGIVALGTLAVSRMRHGGGWGVDDLTARRLRRLRRAF